MSEFSKKKRDRLSQELDWSLDRAQGYVDGEACQLRGHELSANYQSGMDEYSKGFRTGYYTQACSLSILEMREVLTAR